MEAFFDFSGWRVECLTDAYGRQLVMTLGLELLGHVAGLEVKLHGRPLKRGST